MKSFVEWYQRIENKPCKQKGPVWSNELIGIKSWWMNARMDEWMNKWMIEGHCGSLLDKVSK